MFALFAFCGKCTSAWIRLVCNLLSTSNKMSRDHRMKRSWTNCFSVTRQGAKKGQRKTCGLTLLSLEEYERGKMFMLLEEWFFDTGE